MKRATAAVSLTILAIFALADFAKAGGLFVNEFGTPTLGTAGAGAPAGTDSACLGVGALYDCSESTRIGLSFEWLNLGKAEVNDAFVKGDYGTNDAFFFGFNLNWKKLPWSDRGTF